MSRNSPSGQAAARLPQRRPSAEHDAYGAQAPAHPQQGHPQGGYWGQPQAPGYPDPAQGGYPGYGQAPYGQQAPYGEPAFGGYPSQQAYAPQTQRSGSPYGQPQDYSRGGELEAQRGFAPQAPAQPMPFDRFPASSPQGYTPQPGGWPQAGQHQPQHDPRGFDLGHYMPQGGQQQAEPPFQVGPNDHFNQPQHDYADGESHYDEGLPEDEEEDEPRNGRRTLMIVGALVGAIGIGGAMAYTYKSFFGGSASRAPVIKAVDAGPAKVKPPNAGGREIANTDKKLLNRLEDGSTPPGSENEGQENPDDPNAPRRVRIIPIAPGGQPPAQNAATQPSASPTVPGIMLDMGPPQRPQPPQGPGMRPQQMPPPQALPQQQGPRPAAAPVRTVAVNPSPEATPPAPPKKAPVKAAVPKANHVDGPNTASLSTAGTSGFVAVLASQKTRMDALKAFADLQQKYVDVLASKTPDVQEANLGDKGMWYRAVVGPPGSRDGASTLCNQLKTAGYNGCWVTAY